jgi:hypothetical protein
MKRGNHEAGCRRSATTRLVACVTSLAFLWLVVLPMISQRARVRDHLRWLDERRINPSAMYYTELEVLEPMTRLFGGVGCQRGNHVVHVEHESPRQGHTP